MKPTNHDTAQRLRAHAAKLRAQAAQLEQDADAMDPPKRVAPPVVAKPVKPHAHVWDTLSSGQVYCQICLYRASVAS